MPAKIDKRFDYRYESENLKYRAEIYARMKKDEKFVELIKKTCSEDIEYWMNTFCWVVNTDSMRGKTGKRPFILYNYQKKALKKIMTAIDNSKDIVIRKSRRMGASYLVLFTFQWYWLFGNTGNDFLLGSINANKIDQKGVQSTLFGKLRYNLYRQPKGLMPTGFNKRFDDSYMALKNPITNSSITGDINTNFGTSGAYKAVMFDELSKWQKGEDRVAWQSVATATGTRIALSTPFGLNNLYYELATGNVKRTNYIDFHWRECPDFDQRWYDKITKKMSQVDIAQELEMNFRGSVSNLALPNFSRSVVRGQVSRLITDNLPLELNADFGARPMAWVLSQTIQNMRYTFREYFVENTYTEQLISQIIRDYRNWRHKEIYLYGDASGHYNKSQSPFGDWVIIQRALQRAGWKFHLCVPRRNPFHDERLNIANKRLKDIDNNDASYEVIDEGCRNLILSLESTELNSNGGILKNGKEHLFDAWTYGLYEKYGKIKSMRRTTQNVKLRW